MESRDAQDFFLERTVRLILSRSLMGWVDSGGKPRGLLERTQVVNCVFSLRRRRGEEDDKQQSIKSNG